MAIIAPIIVGSGSRSYDYTCTAINETVTNCVRIIKPMGTLEWILIGIFISLVLMFIVLYNLFK